MNGLRELNRAAEGPCTIGVRQHRRATIEWLQRARKALEAGDYELCANLARQAATEVESLIPPFARTAA